jgi:hypothetical protein
MQLEYVPSREKVFQSFRHWHVEPLLNQAADLIDRCKDELKLYNSLWISEEQLKMEIDELEAEIKLEKERLQLYERDLLMAKERNSFYTNSIPNFEKMQKEAQNGYDKEEEGDHKGSGWAKAGQNKAEVKQRRYQHDLDSRLNVKQVAWAESDRKYFEGKLAQKEKLLARKKELTDDFNALGFLMQKKLAFQRLEIYYKDTADRAFAASEGLIKIYNYDSPLEINSDINYNEAVNYLAKWISKGIAWLVAYGQLDQSFTKSFSLLGVVSSEDRNRFRTSTQSCLLTGKIANDLFNGHENVRLRGISATIIGKAGAIPWTLEVKFPVKAFYARAQQNFLVDQSALPSCFLGRVENRIAARAPEICGQISLINASPLGDYTAPGVYWSFKIDRPASGDEKFADIKDILIELNLTGKPLL